MSWHLNVATKGLLRSPILRYTVFVLITIHTLIWILLKANVHGPYSPGLWARSKKQSCIDQAKSFRPSEGDMLSLMRRGRSRPSVAPDGPVLASSNWEGLANETHAGTNDWCCWPFFIYHKYWNNPYMATTRSLCTGFLQGSAETYLGPPVAIMSSAIAWLEERSSPITITQTTQ